MKELRLFSLQAGLISLSALASEEKHALTMAVALRHVSSAQTSLQSLDCI